MILYHHLSTIINMRNHLEFINLKLSDYSKHYSYYDASSTQIYNLGIFFATDVGCPAISWDDWIYNDDKGLETSGNITLLEKEGSNIYLSCFYNNEGNLNITDDPSEKLKISRDNLMQLIFDWKEKVCKKMPQEVTITYKNGIFTLRTSDDIARLKKAKLIIFLFVVIDTCILLAVILWYFLPNKYLPSIFRI